MNVLVVFGTRPEAIKLAPVIQELQRRAGDSRIRTVVCVTAQHREMLDQVLDLFEITPDYDFNLMAKGQTLSQIASAVIASIEPILERTKPHWVVVQGDTTSVAAASLAAYYSRAKVAHVEAGLRTHDKWQPYPEEINRKVAGIIADLHFAPTTQARQNLLLEGVPEHQIVVTGNPVIDALNYAVELPVPSEAESILSQLITKDGTDKPRLILVTAHRRENFGTPIESICLALRDLASRYQRQIHIVYPVHLNPNVREPVYRILDKTSNITLLPPLDYLSFVHIMKNAYLVLTDSGGIQEEAPTLGKPVLVLRDTTERPEAVETGTVRVIGTDRERIVAQVINLLETPDAYRRMARAVNPYGDGSASQRIVSALLGEVVEPFVPDSDQRQ